MLFTFSAIAQTDKEVGKFGFGIKGGLFYGSTILLNNTNVSEIGLPSYTFGIFGDVALKNNFGIQTGLNFTRLAFKGSSNYTSDWNEHLNYIYLPILVKYTIQKTGFSILGGLEIGSLQTAKYTQDSKEYDDMSSYKKIDFGPIFGIDYHFKSGIELAMRKTLGVLNIAKNSPDNTIELPSGTYVTIGYRFK
jgi:hypothetical protein